MKCIILGDPHVGKSSQIGRPGTAGKLNSRIQDQVDLLYWVQNKAIENDAKCIVVTGDVFEESRPHPTLINLFMTWLKDCERKDIDVHIIAGNHDILRTGAYTYSALDLVPAVEFSHAHSYKNITTVNYDGLSITLLPFRDRRMYEVETTQEALDILINDLDTEFKTVPQNNKKLLIGHLAIENSLSIGDEIDDELNEIFCPPDTFKSWDYTWMGHIHNAQVRHEKTEDEPYYVAHVGSMDRSDFSQKEMLSKKIIILYDSDLDEFKEIELPNRHIYKLDIQISNDVDSTEFVNNYLTQLNQETSLKDSLLKIEIKLPPEAKNVDRQKVLDHLYNTIKAHYVCYFSESRIIDLVISDSASVIDNSMTPEAAIDMFWENMPGLSEQDKIECLTLAKSVNKMFEQKENEKESADL